MTAQELANKYGSEKMHTNGHCVMCKWLHHKINHPTRSVGTCTHEDMVGQIAVHYGMHCAGILFEQTILQPQKN